MQNNNNGTNKHITSYISESTKLIQLSNQGANIQQITQILVKKLNKVKSYPQTHQDRYIKFYQQKFQKMNKITDIQINDIPELQNMAKIQVPLYHLQVCTGSNQYFTKYEPIISKTPFIIILHSYIIEICQNQIMYKQNKQKQNIYYLFQLRFLLLYFCAFANSGGGSILIVQKSQNHNTILQGISYLSEIQIQIIKIGELVEQILKNIQNSQNICISFQKVDLRNSNGQIVIRILINRKINTNYYPHHIFGVKTKPYQYIPITEKISLEYYVIKKSNNQKAFHYQKIRQQQIYQFLLQNYQTKNKNKNSIKQKYYKQNKFEHNLINKIHFSRIQAWREKLPTIYKDMFIQINLKCQTKNVQQKIKSAMYKVNINSYLFDIRHAFYDDWLISQINYTNNMQLNTIFYLRLRGDYKQFYQKLVQICQKQILKDIKIFEIEQELIELKVLTKQQKQLQIEQQQLLNDQLKNFKQFGRFAKTIKQEREQSQIKFTFNSNQIYELIYTYAYWNKVGKRIMLQHSSHIINRFNNTHKIIQIQINDL